MLVFFQLNIHINLRFNSSSSALQWMTSLWDDLAQVQNSLWELPHRTQPAKGRVAFGFCKRRTPEELEDVRKQDLERVVVWWTTQLGQAGRGADNNASLPSITEIAIILSNLYYDYVVITLFGPESLGLPPWSRQFFCRISSSPHFLRTRPKLVEWLWSRAGVVTITWLSPKWLKLTLEKRNKHQSAEDGLRLAEMFGGLWLSAEELGLGGNGAQTDQWDSKH